VYILFVNNLWIDEAGVHTPGVKARHTCNIHRPGTYIQYIEAYWITLRRSDLGHWQIRWLGISRSLQIQPCMLYKATRKMDKWYSRAFDCGRLPGSRREDMMRATQIALVQPFRRLWRWRDWRNSCRPQTQACAIRVWPRCGGISSFGPLTLCRVGLRRLSLRAMGISLHTWVQMLVYRFRVQGRWKATFSDLRNTILHCQINTTTNP